MAALCSFNKILDKQAWGRSKHVKFSVHAAQVLLLLVTNRTDLL